MTKPRKIDRVGDYERIDGKLYPLGPIGEVDSFLAQTVHGAGPRPGQGGPDNRSALKRWLDGPGPRGKSERGCG